MILLGLFVNKKRWRRLPSCIFVWRSFWDWRRETSRREPSWPPFARELEVTAKSSLELFLDGLMAGWENNYVLGIFRGLCGKLLALFAGSFLLLCPGLWYGVKRVFAKTFPKGKVAGLFQGLRTS